MIGSSERAIFAVPIPKTKTKTIIGAINIIDLGKRSITRDAMYTK